MSPHIIMSYWSKYSLLLTSLFSWWKEITPLGIELFNSMFSSRASCANGQISFATTCEAPARAAAILLIPQPLPISSTRWCRNRSGLVVMQVVKPSPPGHTNPQNGAGKGRSSSVWEWYRAFSSVIKRKLIPHTCLCTIHINVRVELQPSGYKCVMINAHSRKLDNMDDMRQLWSLTVLTEVCSSIKSFLFIPTWDTDERLAFCAAWW